MKVYVVSRDFDWDRFEVIGVFDSKQKAEEKKLRCMKKHKCLDNEIKIEEWEVK